MVRAIGGGLNIAVALPAAAGVVAVAVGGLLWRRRRAGTTKATPALTTPTAVPEAPPPVVIGERSLRVTPEIAHKVDVERDRADRIDEFERLVASPPAADGTRRVIDKLSYLDDQSRRRLSRECALALGLLLADHGQRVEALYWLDESLARDKTYFVNLNRSIAEEILGLNPPVAVLPVYPFQVVPWGGLSNVIKAKARALHELGRHGEVEALLGTFIGDYKMRYLRAELRRMRGAYNEALSDYQVVATLQPGYERSGPWIRKISDRLAALQAGSQEMNGGGRARTESTPQGAGAPDQRLLGSGQQTAWEVLGLPPNASSDDIRTAYLGLSRKYHPDKVATLGEAERRVAETKMRDINRAWMELTRAGLAR